MTASLGYVTDTLTLNGEYAYANDLKNNWDGIAGVFLRETFWLENILSQSVGGGRGGGGSE